MTSKQDTVQINENDIDKTEFLKNALKCKSEDEVVSQSIHVAHRITQVIQSGGKVVLTEKNGNTTQMLIKT